MPEEIFVDQLLQLIMKGLELFSNKILLSSDKNRFVFDSSSIHDRYQKHLVDIFQYKFPLYFIKVLQLILERLKIRKINPKILLVLLNGLIYKGQTETLRTIIEDNHIKAGIIESFSQNQKRLTLTDINDGISLFTTFFKKQKLQKQKIIMDSSLSLTSAESTAKFGNIYTIFQDYCVFLKYWFLCFGQCLVVQVLFTYKDGLGDQSKFNLLILNVLFYNITFLTEDFLFLFT